MSALESLEITDFVFDDINVAFSLNEDIALQYALNHPPPPRPTSSHGPNQPIVPTNAAPNPVTSTSTAQHTVSANLANNTAAVAQPTAPPNAVISTAALVTLAQSTPPRAATTTASIPTQARSYITIKSIRAPRRRAGHSVKRKPLKRKRTTATSARLNPTTASGSLAEPTPNGKRIRLDAEVPTAPSAFMLEMATYTFLPLPAVINTAYPSSKAHATSLLATHAAPSTLPSPVSLSSAVSVLETLHSTLIPASSARLAALARLRILQGIGASGEWDLSIVYSVFADVDIALFEGMLGGNVALQWVEKLKDEKCEGGYHCKECAALTLWPLVWGRDKVFVLLSKSVLVDGKVVASRSESSHVRKLKGVLGVLVHEMIHVYLTIMTGGDVGEGEFEGDTGHGEGFGRCLQAVNGTLRDGKVGWEALPTY